MLTDEKNPVILHQEQKNILLDYLNPDLRVLLQIPSTRPREIKRLIGWTNLAMLWTKAFCIIPQAFIFEDVAVLQTLKKLEPALDNGMLRIPAPLLDDFHKKAEEMMSEYSRVSHNYNQLSSPDSLKRTADFLSDHPMARIEKRISTGGHIVQSLGENSDNPDTHWSKIFLDYHPSTILSMQRYAVHLLESGIALTHGEFSVRFQDAIKETDIHKMLHTSFGEAYILEYETSPLYNLRAGDFSPIGERRDKRYDYEFLRAAMEPLDLETAIYRLRIEDVISLRNRTTEWDDFRANVQSLIIDSPTTGDVKRFIIKVAEAAGILPSTNQGEIHSVQGIVDLVGKMNDAWKAIQQRDQKRNQRMIENDCQFNILIFVALQEEELIAKNYFDLRASEDRRFLVGNLEDIRLTLISPRKIGRVAAALSVFAYLKEAQENNSVLPDAILILGIAGGFQARDVKRGDVLVPQAFYDVSNTKKEGAKDGKDNYETFRSEPYRVNKRLLKAIHDTVNTNLDEWKIRAKDDARRSDLSIELHAGKPMCCCDSVIKDEEWITDVLERVHTDLRGIDMESTGVVQAVEWLNLPVDVSVVRGVSDLANPLKADDDWRQKAMYSACSLIKYLGSRAFR